MDLLGHLGQTGDNAQSPNPARDRGSSVRKTPSLLLAWLSASPTQRGAVVRKTIALTNGGLAEPLIQRSAGPAAGSTEWMAATHLKDYIDVSDLGHH